MTSIGPSFLLLLLGSFGIALTVQAVRLGFRWSVGLPADVRPVAGIVRLPWVFFTTVHDKVAEDRPAANMHAMVFGGFAVTLLSTAAIALYSISDALRIAGLLGAGAFLIGIGRQLARHWPKPLGRLSGGPYNWLFVPFALIGLFFVVTLSGLSNASPIAAVASGVAGIAGFAWFAWWCADGPMRHAIAGAIYLVCHPRPRRLRGDYDAALMVLDLDAPRLGAGATADFPWSSLAGFDACVQCGRCETMCPAFAAGMPLNPKRLIQDLALGIRSEGTVVAYDGHPHPGVPAATVSGGPLAGLLASAADGFAAPIAQETLWACTTCRACVEACPMMIEHVDAIVSLRQFTTLELGTLPAAAARATENLRETDTISGRACASRLDWATDLSLPILANVRRCRTLLWLGEGAFDTRNQRTLRALVRLMRLAGEDFAVLGNEELDTGDLARRLGDEASFQRLAAANIQTLSRYEFERIVTADPHVLHALRNEYPPLGGRYCVLHHSALIEDYVTSGRLEVPAAARPERVAYHDPCYLGRYNGEIDAPRKLLDAFGLDRLEMERSGKRSRCCGGGGGGAVIGATGGESIQNMRVADARAVGAEIIAVACPTCALMLESAADPLVVADLAELVLDAVDQVH